MATGTKNDLIHCENCGEDYSATYKRCPFCDERAETRRSNTRGGGYGGGITPAQVIGMVVSVALIALAVWIVFSLVAPLIGVGESDNPTPPVDPSPGVTATADPTSDPTADPTTDPTADPTASPDPDATADPDVTVDPPPALTGNVTAITLSSKDFTLSKVGESSRLTATLAPADSGATVTWETADNSIARVSADGVVTAVGNGTTTITAKAGGVSAECIVRVKNQGTDGGTGTSAEGTSTGSYTLSHTDVTIKVGEAFTIKLREAGSVTWSSSNTSIATVDANGKVTGASKGTTNISCTYEGVTYTCIVRVNAA